MHKTSVLHTLTNRAPQYAAEDREAATNNNSSKPMNTNRPMLGLPHVAGLSEQLGRVFKLHNVHLYHKLSNTLRSMVVHPKDKIQKKNQCGTIYHITCGNNSRHTYIGETKRTLSQRFKEHTTLDKHTGVGNHCLATGHSVSMDNTKILAREQNWHKRKGKEAIYIKQRGPTMNRHQGNHLSAIYNQIIPPTTT